MIILSTGPHRSGSTWMYNVLRMICIENNKSVYGSFVNKYDLENESEVHVVKLHGYIKSMKAIGDLTFMTVRDIRDIIASAVRRDMVQPTMLDVERYARKIIRREYNQWSTCCDLQLRYEDIMKSKPKAISKIAKVMSMPVDPIKVSRLVEDIPIPNDESEFNAENQLHHNHITNGVHGSYKTTLPKDIVGFLEHEYQWFLKRHGYLK